MSFLVWEIHGQEAAEVLHGRRGTPQRDGSPWRTCAGAGAPSEALQPVEEPRQGTGAEQEGRRSTENPLCPWIPTAGPGGNLQQ